MIQIDPRDGAPIYRQVMDQIKLQVNTGQLVAGQQLESVASLSKRLKVNPMTISKAYGFLVEEGIVERRRGVGIFVAEVETETAEENRNRCGALKMTNRVVPTMAPMTNMRSKIPSFLAIQRLRSVMDYFERRTLVLRRRSDTVESMAL